MTDDAKLERRYWRLLAWFPRDFRRENGQEIIAVLMACAPENQRRPGLAAKADLIKSGMWMRLRPNMPRSEPTVRAAVLLMYAGAVVTTLSLIIASISLAYIGRGDATLRVAGRNQTLPVTVAVGIVIGLVEIAMWLWMARANGQGRNWARILSTVLFGVATLHLWGNKDVAEVVFAVLTWLLAVTAVWLLWSPTSTDFYNRQGFARAGQSA